MKEKILKLRKDGKTYNEIKEILGCSKGTISYYCGENQKIKSNKRLKKRRKNTIINKLERFKYRKPKRYVQESLRFFQKRDNNFDNKINKNLNFTFKLEDVLEKFGENTFCYLSGEKINLYENNYNFDHVIPISRGGDNSFENLGVTHEIVNSMKSSLTPEELIEWCIKILKFNGYNIEKK
jgi:5-methylcytosine-specific restriction endonuclease McrA